MTRRTTATAHPLNFTQLSGTDFERLAFAFMVRRWSWKSIEWYGQVGADHGRDIRCVRDEWSGRPEVVFAACANWKRLTLPKARQDLTRMLGAGERPSEVLLFAGGTVSAKLRDDVRAFGEQQGIYAVSIVSGPELEELLRVHAPSVLRRFWDGEAFPDDPQELIGFVSAGMTDDDALRQLAKVFDRPAFQVRFSSESSLPHFRQALEHTIEAINTGLWRSRDGTLIQRLPSRLDFESEGVSNALREVVVALQQVRGVFDDGLRRGRIQPCGCGQPDCPTFMLEPNICDQLDDARSDVLRLAAQVLPGITPLGGRW